MAASHGNGPRILLLPGWQNSGAGHWQTLWETQPGFERVQQDDWLWPKRGDWMAQLEQAVLEREGPVALAAHSLGCQLVAAWAAHSAHSHRVEAALLVAPPDTARADMPPQLAGWRHIVRQRLPFPSIVVFSSDDPYCEPARAQAMAAEWGAALHPLHGKGHINAESGLGDWPAGLSLLQSLIPVCGLPSA